MTYTILGCNPATGRVGIALATHSIAAGGYCQVVQSSRGAIASQAFADPRLLPLATGLLDKGAEPDYIVSRLGDLDPDYAYRQVAVLMPDGIGAAHTGPETPWWSNHVFGENCIAAGNALSSEEVTAAMAAAFEAAGERSVEDRLVAGLEAGRDAGGQRDAFYERSATLVVCERETFPDIDLRVDYHREDAVAELRSLLERYKPYLHIYNHLRTKEPRRAAELTTEEWDPTVGDS